MAKLIEKFNSGGTSSTNADNELKRQALQNPNHDNWRDAYSEYSGKKGSLKDKREFRKAWKNEVNVKARIGEDIYNQLRTESEQKQFGTQGYNSGSTREKNRFDRRFNRNLQTYQIPQTPQLPKTPQTSQTSKTNGTVIYPWMWDAYQIKPRKVIFSQFPIGVKVEEKEKEKIEEKKKEEEKGKEDPNSKNEQKIVKETEIEKSPNIVVDNKQNDQIQSVPETPIVLVSKTPDSTPVNPTDKKINIRDFEYFRAPHAFANNNGRPLIVTVNGKKYPIGVTKNNLSEYGLEEDQTYAFDEDTGKFIKIKENMFGAVKGGFDYAQFEGDWIDPNSYYQKRQDWLKENPEPQKYPTYGAQRFTPEWIEWNKKYTEINPSFYKQGGKMNKIKYFQQGGVAPQQQDVQQQIIQLVQAAMQGDQQATQTIQQVMQAAEQGDQQAQQLAQMIQQVAEQIKGQATMAKWGSKLKYIKSLKHAKGDKTCSSCQKNLTKSSFNKVEEKACGGKTKKIKK